MRLPSLPVNAQAAVAAALMCCSLTLAPPAFGVDSVDNIYGTAGEFTKAKTLDGGYRGSVPGQDKQIASGKGAGAEKMENSKIQGGGASTLQGGRRIVITRGVNLDSAPTSSPAGPSPSPSPLTTQPSPSPSSQPQPSPDSNWKGEDLRGVAFQQSVVRNANFEVC
tara:strand:- start:184 stop:681 length:498 start_codon:yes stop_codon:yes gene_type:complete